MEPVQQRRRHARVLAGVLTVAALLAAACTDDDGDDGATTTTAAERAGAAEDTARYILPPGNDGGVPTSDHSLDQLPLYDGLTPLRDQITEEHLEELFLPEDLAPIEPTTVEETGRDGLEIVYDAYGIPHITGETREDVAFGGGWVAARDRDLLVRLARGPARAAVADVPGIDAFSLVTGAQTFEPSAEAEALVDAQWDLLEEVYGEEGAQIRADAEAAAEGANAYYESTGNTDHRVTANDVLAVTAFIGSIFGAGGGGEVDNAELLAQLQAGLGEVRGEQAWEDSMMSLDPEAPTTIDEEFPYGPLTGGEVTGSVQIDLGSVVPLDPVGRQPGEAPDTTTTTTADTTTTTEAPPTTAGATTSTTEAATTTSAPTTTAPAGGGNDEQGLVDATARPPGRQASNWLLVNGARSATGSTQAVMGPQLGYYYPEIVQQIHITSPDFDAQGIAVPGVAPYILIGRTRDYAWSLTSAGHDVRDVFAERLCEPDGSTPTRESTHYEFEGECRPMEEFNAGTLNGEPVTYPVTVHGPVIGTATVDGQPVALSRQRSTFGRDGLNLVALKQMTEGEAATPEDFFDVANRFEYTFNWAYASRTDTAYFSSGRMPVRAEGLDRRLPTLGTGEYEWQGFLERDEHPHAVGGPDDLLLNWNNQSAPGFMHGDGDGEGSHHRVELFDDWPEAPKLTDVVGIMNRAATQDPRSTVWPIISEVLAGGDAPDDLSAEVVTLLDEWVERDAPRLDADDDGNYDDAAPAVFDELWLPMVRAVLEPVYGDTLDALDEVRPLRSFGASFMDKDLRTLLEHDVEGPFQLQYCGGGDLDACRESLWAVVSEVAAGLAEEHGDDPTAWLVEAQRTEFVPGLIEDSMRWTNRPTFQQVIEFARSGASDGGRDGAGDDGGEGGGDG